MRAGQRRLRVTLESPVQSIDGGSKPTWVIFAADVPASYLAGPGREFMAAEAVRAEITGRFEMLYLPGVTAAMRLRCDGRIYNLKAPPAVDPTGRTDMILMVGSGLNDG